MTDGLRPPKVDWLTQMRFILSYLLNPCDAPWTLYLELSSKPTGRLLLMVLGFDVEDFVQGLFSPKTHGKERKGRKRNRRGQKSPGIPDMTDELAGRVAHNAGLDQYNYSMGTRMFFVILNRVEYVNFTSWLVEESTDIAMDAIWGVIDAKGVNCTDLGRFLGQREGGIFGGVGPLWRAIAYQNKRYAIGCTSISTFSVGLGPGKWVCTFACTIKTRNGANSNCAIRIIRNGHPIEGGQAGPIHVAWQSEVDFIATVTVRDGGSIGWEIASETGHIECVRADMSCLEVEV